MQPLYITAYGNGKGLFRQSLMKMEKDCWANAYSNSVLQLAATVSYRLWQQCLTDCGNSVLQLICGKVGVFPGYLKLLFPETDVKV
jgi:hypothetical protein